MNTADIIIISLIALALTVSLLVIIKKRGKNCSCSALCGGECSSCKASRKDKIKRKDHKI